MAAFETGDRQMNRATRARRSEGPPPYVPGAIVSDALYRLDEAAARLGWGGHALRAARRRGLKIHRCGKRGYVAGRDLLDFITKGDPHAN
jgi:hypothetical protein